MSDLLLTEGFVVLEPHSNFITYNQNSEVTLSEGSVVLTESTDIIHQVSVETNTDFTVIETVYFEDFNQGGTGGGKSFPEAPTNNKLYARRNRQWVELNNTSFPPVLDTYLYGKVAVFDSFRLIAIGQGTDVNDRFISVKELKQIGVIKDDGSGGLVDAGPVYMEIPPQPRNLRLVPGLANIQIYWDNPKDLYLNHGSTRIYRNTTNSIGTASIIANTPSSTGFLDVNPVWGVTYYYWIRFVSLGGVNGPSNGPLTTTLTNAPANILQQLIGQIEAEHLIDDLREPIELITASDGIIFQQQQNAQDIVNETNNRVAALLSEQNARNAALLEEIEAREDGISSVTVLLNNNVESLKQQIDTITAVSNASFNAEKAWYFDSSIEGWTANGGAPVNVGGRLRPPFSSSTYITSPLFEVYGGTDKELRVRIRKIGAPIWDGTLIFTDDLAQASSAQIPEPVFYQDYATAVWDMSQNNVWTNNFIQGLQIQAAAITNASNYFEFDWIAVGNLSPGASSTSIATFQNQLTVLSNALTAEVGTRETLAAQMRGTYTGNSINALTTGLLYQERVARATADSAMASQITALSAGTNNQFDYSNIWYFDTGLDGFTGTPSNPTVVAGYLRPVAGSGYVQSPTLNIDGTKYPQIRLRIKKFGSPTWLGQFNYITVADTAWDGVKQEVIAAPTFDADNIAYITVTVTHAKWVANTITALRITLPTSSNSTDHYDIDWVAIGRPSPGASAADLIAEQLARTDGDSALASSITALTTTVAGKATQSSVDTLTSRVTTAEGTISSQGTKLTQIDSQLFPDLINTNPSLTITGSGALPDTYTAWDPTGLSKYIGALAYGGLNALTMTCTSTTNSGIRFDPNPALISNHAFVDVEIVFTVTAGTSLSGAGLIFDWDNSVPANFRTYVMFKDIYPTPVLNKKIVCKARLQRPAGYTGAFATYQIWLMGNYSELGVRTNHTIVFASLKIFGADASASAVSLLDARVSTAEGNITSSSSSIVNLNNQLAVNTNALDDSVWLPNTIGNQGSGASVWTENWSTGVVNRVYSYLNGPFGPPEYIWVGTAGTDQTGGSGGFDTSVAPANKIHRARGAVFYFFFKHDGVRTGSNPGVFYFGGPYSKVVDLPAGGVNGNPYFLQANIDLFAANEWYLAYGVVKGYDGFTTPTGLTGVYRLNTGEQVLVGQEFMATSDWNAGPQSFRTYLFYSNQAGRNVYWARPTVLPLDKAPTPWELMRQDKRLPATATALTALTTEVHDSVNGLAATVARTTFLEANVPGAGGNLILTDTEFLTNEGGWSNATRDLFGASYIPYNLHQIGRVFAGSPVNFSMISPDIPVVGLKRYGFSGYQASYRSTTEFIILFYDGASALLGSATQANAFAGGGNSLNSWNLGFMFATAPAGAMFARVQMRCTTGSGLTDPCMWLCRPMFSEVTATQTAPVRWAPSTGGALARIASEETARATADSAIATNVTNVTTTVNGHTSTIATHQTSIDGISAQYMVKLDVNGYVAGFGLYNSGGSSSFIINADKFAIAKPGAIGVFPFVVDSVNNRVAIDAAYIKSLSVGSLQLADLSVTNAKLANLSVDNAKISSLNAAKIIAGTITTDKLVLGAASSTVTVDTGSTSMSVSSINSSGTLNSLTAGSIAKSVNGSAVNMNMHVEFVFTTSSSIANATYEVSFYAALATLEDGSGNVYRAINRPISVAHLMYLKSTTSYNFTIDFSVCLTNSYFIGTLYGILKTMRIGIQGINPTISPVIANGMSYSAVAVTATLQELKV